MRTASVIFAILLSHETWAFDAFRSRCPKPMIPREEVVSQSGRKERISAVASALPRTILLASNGGDDWAEKAIGGLRSNDLVARVSAGSSFSLSTSTDSPSLPPDSNEVNGWESPELLANENVGGTQVDATIDQAATSNLTALLSRTPDNRFRRYDRSQY